MVVCMERGGGCARDRGLNLQEVVSESWVMLYSEDVL